jgi:hypothetical protein
MLCVFKVNHTREGFTRAPPGVRGLAKLSYSPWRLELYDLLPHYTKLTRNIGGNVAVITLLTLEPREEPFGCRGDGRGS